MIATAPSSPERYNQWMSPLALPRSPLAALLVSSVALVFSACGGTSVQHIDDPDGAGGKTGGTSGKTGGTGGSGGATGGTGAATATGGTGTMTGGSGGTPIGSGGTPIGTGGTTIGTGGATAGTLGKPPLTCDEVVGETQAELSRIQSCRADSECGQVLEGTSCGCTRDLVARFDADASRFHDLKDQANAMGCDGFGSTCDCPTADGFACEMGRCTWNYVNDEPPPPICTPASLGTMCIVGVRQEAGYALLAGSALTLSFQPSGCYSSSCTKVLTSSCDVKPDLNDFYVSASMCLTEVSDPNAACTDDCAGGGSLACPTMQLLTEGTHTVHFVGDSSLDLTFKVPSLVNAEDLCVTVDHLR